MPQTEIQPVSEGCRHLRGRYKLLPSHRSPFPERRLIRYECELGHEITSDEDFEQCVGSKVECWRNQTKATKD
ncbi:MAG TPA: hypothetical protein PLZ21_12170 [Armatimonadota bacterium]|jgi:hypothetical protein|nr:hypothetical protein [Armatimonadota bacterium]HOP81313.1 hypothetical protein [Armatimonadota bacterium]